MSNAIVEFLAARPARERALIGVLMLVILPLAVAFGVLLPLQDSHRDAQRAQANAIALQAWVVDRVIEKQSLGQGPTVQTRAPIGSSGIEQSLIDAGLRDDVSQLGVRDAGVIELRFDLVTFQTLADWLSASKPDWGYDITTLRIEASDDPGKVSASLTLAPSN